MTRTICIFAITLAAFLLVGCSSGSGATTSSPAATVTPQTTLPGELASTSIEVQLSEQRISIGYPLTGGDYLITVECVGEEHNATTQWSAPPGNDHGDIEIGCSPEGEVTHQPVTLRQYSRGIEVLVNGLVGSTVTISVASQ